MTFVAVVALLLTAQVDKPPEPETPSIKPAGLLAASVGTSFQNGVLPTGAMSLALGLRFANGIGIVALAHGRIALLPTADGSLQIYGLGAGVRFGERSHVTIGVSPTVAVFEVPVNPGTRAGVSILAHLVLRIGEYFAVLLQPVIDFTEQAIIGSATIGAGVTF
ncbi:MAG: hypothetical protein JNM17_18745 [Archangium sp.]|nr:hypothetical protein [Archangium sp.]